jgi:Bacterial type III secretion protein (HrpB7)
MSRQRALRLLAKVRARRAKALEEAVKEATNAHRQALQAEDNARDAVQDAVEEELAEVGKLQQVTSAGQTFDINELLYRQHHSEILKKNVVTCQNTLEQNIQGTGKAKQEVRARRLVVTRNEQKTQSLKDQIGQIQAAAQLAADDAQDEDAEESAISRMILASKAASAGAAR